jgi:hypothetical protein
MGRGKMRYQNSRKGIDESDPTQIGQEEEIVTLTRHMRSRKGRPEEKEGKNPSDPFQKTSLQCTNPGKGKPEDKEGSIQVIVSQKPQN